MNKLCRVTWEAESNCSALVVPPGLITLRNGGYYIFGRASLLPNCEKEFEARIIQTVPILFASGCLLTQSKIDQVHFLLENWNNKIQLVETQGVNSPVLIKLAQDKKYLLHQGD